DVKVLLNRSLRVGKESPLGTDRRTEFLKRVVVVSGDRDDPRVSDSDLGIKCCELQMLLMLLRAVVTPRECENQRILALHLAEPPQSARIIGQFVVGKNTSGHDIRAHGKHPRWVAR